ncbi:Leucine Rich Repeat [Seminavis robusta]|uniref:Leucine Rich Repeat n=1 Tax=Seminavis robusta TaxID=568900 RepID=A0A9N8HFS1_9STRA|nr:Leucine Rich Repeat [Seminavis robusta]|eukprot:Sro470_g149600.1 Leucine Rich Repeat (685) ;mRNA; r:50873-53165
MSSVGHDDEFITEGPDDEKHELGADTSTDKEPPFITEGSDDEKPELGADTSTDKEPPKPEEGAVESTTSARPTSATAAATRPDTIEDVREEIQPLPPIRAPPQTDGPGAYAMGGRALGARGLAGPVRAQEPTRPDEVAAPEDTGAGLAQARPVEEDEQRDIEVATPVQAREQAKDASKGLLLILLLCVLVVIVAAVVVVLRSRADSDEQTSPRPTASPSVQPTEMPSSDQDKLLALLPDYTVTAIQQGSNAQSQAWDWMLEDPSFDRYDDERRLQRFGLAVLYFSTKGHEWITQDSFLNYTLHECEWMLESFDPTLADQTVTRLSCDPTNQSATRLVFNTNNLAGYLPRELALLTSLQELIIMRHPGLVGTLPTEIAKMRALESIAFHNNRFTGILPTELLLLNNLRRLALEGNLFEGTIHTEFGLFSTNLSHLTFDTNRFFGTIPSELGLLTTLTRLQPVPNQFDPGTIPTELGCLTEMRELLLSGQNTTGPIPSELGMMTNLFRFSASKTLLTGPIPTTIGQWTKVRSVNIDFSPLITGPIPSEFAGLSEAVALSLGSNSLVGTIPSELGNFPNMKVLDLSSNALVGPIPSELARVPMRLVSLQNNQLTGTLPAEFDPRSSGPQGALNIVGNNLTGSIPEGLCFLMSPSCNWSSPSMEGSFPCHFNYDCEELVCSCETCTCP